MLILKYIRKEPLFIFLFFASLIFIADYFYNKKNSEIIIDNATALAVLSQEKELKGRELTEEEKKLAVGEYIDNKILLNEAIKLGLNNDRGIQATLLRKHRAFITASLQEPTDSELKSYYEEHSQDYLNSTMYDIEQIHLEVGSSFPVDVIANLHDRNKINQWLSDNKIALAQYLNMSEQEIMARMGKDVSDAVVKMEINTWIEPIYNSKGVFLIYLIKKSQGDLRPFEEVKQYVREAWINTHQKIMVQQKVKELKENYKIIILED